LKRDERVFPTEKISEGVLNPTECNKTNHEKQNSSVFKNIVFESTSSSRGGICSDFFEKCS